MGFCVVEPRGETRVVEGSTHNSFSPHSVRVPFSLSFSSRPLLVTPVLVGPHTSSRESVDYITMKISFVQTFLLIAVAILGLATAETQMLRGANVEAIANSAVLKNERDLRGLFAETEHSPSGETTVVDAGFNFGIDELVLDFNLGALIDFLFSFGSFGFNFNFFSFQSTGGGIPFFP